MKKLLQRKEGFTLIELLIVVAIIGIVAGIAIPRFLGARTTARVTRAFADMRTIADALEMYFIDNSEYPAALADLTTSSPPYITSIPGDQFGTNFGYYTDASPATMWLIVSNGPDGDKDIVDAQVKFDSNPVSGELGGPNGATGDHYNSAAGGWTWSPAASASDDGDIGRGGP